MVLAVVFINIFGFTAILWSIGAIAWMAIAFIHISRGE